MNKQLSQENRIKLYEWTLSKPLNWVVLCVTCFLGFITIVSIIPTSSCAQNIFFITSGIIMSLLVAFSIKRIFDNFQYLVELERGFPDDIKIFLDKTTSSPQKLFFGKSKLSPARVKNVLFLTGLLIGLFSMILVLILKSLNF